MHPTLVAMIDYHK